jgi:hypothetical protein
MDRSFNGGGCNRRIPYCTGFFPDGCQPGRGGCVERVEKREKRRRMRERWKKMPQERREAIRRKLEQED